MTVGAGLTTTHDRSNRHGKVRLDARRLNYEIYQMSPSPETVYRVSSQKATTIHGLGEKVATSRDAPRPPVRPNSRPRRSPEAWRDGMAGFKFRSTKP
jgi:hypothetical protein